MSDKWVEVEAKTIDDAIKAGLKECVDWQCAKNFPLPSLSRGLGSLLEQTRLELCGLARPPGAAGTP